VVCHRRQSENAVSLGPNCTLVGIHYLVHDATSRYTGVRSSVPNDQLIYTIPFSLQFADPTLFPVPTYTPQVYIFPASVLVRDNVDGHAPSEFRFSFLPYESCTKCSPVFRIQPRQHLQHPRALDSVLTPAQGIKLRRVAISLQMILVVTCWYSCIGTVGPKSCPDMFTCSPVYEYPLNGQWIMMDIDDGYILWTGIWKGGFHSPCYGTNVADIILSLALGNSKGV